MKTQCLEQKGKEADDDDENENENISKHESTIISVYIKTIFKFSQDRHSNQKEKTKKIILRVSLTNRKNSETENHKLQFMVDYYVNVKKKK